MLAENVPGNFNELGIVFTANMNIMTQVNSRKR